MTESKPQRECFQHYLISANTNPTEPLFNLPPHNPPRLYLIRQRRQPIRILIELRNQLQDGCYLDISAILVRLQLAQGQALDP